MNPAGSSEVDPNKSSLQYRTSSNSGNFLLSLDHSHTQKSSTTILGLENSNNEVNHNLLKKMFSLSTLEADSPADQQAAMVYSAVSIHGKASQTQASLSGVHPIGVTKVQKIRLGDLIKKFIADLSAHDKKLLLPTGFIDRNQAVLQAVREQIQETIKSKKGTLQGCCFEFRSGDVPTISKLYNHIQQHLPYGGEFFAPNKIPLIAQVWFTYMRLEMIIYALGTSSARAAQWGPINKQLQYLKTKGADYFIVWSNLIIQNDKYFFGSPKQFAQLRLDVSVLPTKDDIQQAMATSCD
ncbi:hypothetical protein PGTUg99_033384 [Puccinia graminis f. sp. tritici]|uniref:Uncharacterized protein n=1 Tax=Puccinia graminis f. sp. tritici TaxID=56615 RepID=A0A5B0SBU2_PUCGR|nr:hypothetical protein PGTUg99_033384 [Puccinia graminis f. sp. tritici]